MRYKKYIGTKEVEAEPMTRGNAWCEHLLRERPMLQNCADAGYHVKYNDGYESWVPAETFEKEYKCVGTSLDRLLNDKQLIEKNIAILAKFMESPQFLDLSMEKRLLIVNKKSTLEDLLDITNGFLNLEDSKNEKSNS